MNKYLIILISIITTVIISSCSTFQKNIDFDKRESITKLSSDSPPFYGKDLCNTNSNNIYRCIAIFKNDTWESLFPEPNLRKIIMNLNRTNMELKYREWLIVPKNFNNIDYIKYSPFPDKISNPNKKRKIIISIKEQAYAAYNSKGELVKWGSANTGEEDDIERRTPKGNFAVYRKKGEQCKSRKYPIPKGGAPMPYCMFFHKGYAIHGDKMPGFPVSLGCVRIDIEDAKWLYKFSPIDTEVIVKG